MPGPRLLLVDDSEAFRRSLGRALRREYVVETAASAEEAQALLDPPPDAVLLDLRLDEADPSDAQAKRLLGRLRADLPATPVIVITAYGNVETAVECMRLGAADFIEKTNDLTELKARIEKAMEQARVARRLRQLEEELAIVEPRRLVGESDVMRGVKEMIAAVARDGQVTVLVTGETGTGKELVARAIHASGPRAQHPFVPVAIAALAPSVVESELFGHEAGAFTGAQGRHAGFIERAHRGVLFLDEITELETAIQVKLLRVLEERVITRVGGSREIPVDVQVVAATNADLPDLVAEGRFREDLYYRLKVTEIHLPPLREHAEDIPLLVEHFLRTLGAPRGVEEISPAATDALSRHRWPGNVRELRNVMEAAALHASLRRAPRIELADLPQELRSTNRGGARLPTRAPGPIPLEEALARAELEQAELALQKTGGKKSEAYQLLGLNDRFVFTRRLKRLCERFPELARNYPSVVAAFLEGGADRKSGH